MDEGVRLHAAEFPYGRQGGIQRPGRERVCRLLGVLVRRFLPGVGLFMEAGQAGRCGDGQAVVQPRGDGRHLVAVLDLRQGGRLWPLQQRLP